ncbi:MAG: glycerophosphodiester phosphodiesterase [Bacteroidia bacterium]
MSTFIHFFAFCSCFLLLSSFVSAQNDKKITLTGHRGAAGLAPENTLASVQKALDLGCERIEIDVHQTIDKRIVVIHDKTIDRTTNGIGLIKEMNFAEIGKYSAGIKFDKNFESEKIPTLEEVIELINGRCVLVIEVKDGNSYYPDIEKNIVTIIQKYHAKKWCLVHSFSDEVLRNFHALDSEIILHKLFIKKVFYNFKKYDYVQEFSFYWKFLHKSTIKKVHKLGKKVNVWTVNEPENMQKMVEKGVDGIITNFPNLYKKEN